MSTSLILNTQTKKAEDPPTFTQQASRIGSHIFWGLCDKTQSAVSFVFNKVTPPIVSRFPNATANI
ncbi:MAG: hypothetical protein K1000chlam3_01523, partial [Chlamydiae bacterium]|nr:hypothetical protein [Chlamydiota bacterium]